MSVSSDSCSAGCGACSGWGCGGDVGARYVDLYEC